MDCSKCHTTYEVTSIGEGQTKFCKNCGNILYRNDGGNIIFNTGTIISNDFKKQEEKELKELQEQEKLIKQRQQQLLFEQEERERKKRIEEEKIEQERLEKERIERERIEKILRAQEEKERQLHAKIELEVREKLYREQEEKDKLRKEQERHELERKELERLRREKLELEKQKLLEDALITDQTSPERIQSEDDTPKKRYVLYLTIPILIILCIALVYFFYPEKLMAVFNKNNNTISGTSMVEQNISEDSLRNELQRALTGKEILSWGVLKLTDIKSLEVLNKKDSVQNKLYTVSANLDDNNGTKANAELSMKYNDQTLEQVITEKITYKNTAPVNAWFSFPPVKDCDIFVNTNNIPIRIKGCANCATVKMNTEISNPEKLINHPASIFITSDSKTEAVVEFIYVPIK